MDMDQNFELGMPGAPKMKKIRDFRVSPSTCILCVLLACLFVFMATYVTISLQAERKINEAYARVGEYEKLLEIAECYDKYYLYGVDFDQTADRLAGLYGYAAGDWYSDYYTAEQWEESYNASIGNATGVGIYVAMNDDGNILVARVMQDSPAKRDGLMEGDIITAVDGHAVLDIGYENAVNLFMGESGTKVSFEVLRGTEEWEITVTRGMYDPQTVFAETVTVEGELYGYIQILQFEFSTSNQFISAVDKLMEMGAKGFVFDVRDNPGGYIDAAIAMLDYLLPEGPIVHFEARGEIETVSSDAHSVDLPMVVLVNGGTASSSELFASALKDYGKAEIVGEQTYGKGCVQEGIVLSDGSIIYITMYLYNPPFSENYDGVGIMPDHPIYLVKEWRSTDVLLIPHEEDNQLGKALDVLHINTKFTQ